MSNHKNLEDALLKAYRELHKESQPEWAVHKKYDQTCLVKPTIPFVGKEYTEQETKLLVYASAEALSDYYPGSSSERPWLDEDTQAINRHRVRFESTKHDDCFFPDLHIQPIYDGTLTTAALYIASHYTEIHGLSPREFCERIAIANYSKYTKETERQKNIRMGSGNYGSDKNVDPTQMYPEEEKIFLAESHSFLEADLEFLRPNLIILPKKLYAFDRHFWDVQATKIGAKIIGIYQLGPTPINCTIPKDRTPKAEGDLSPTIDFWRKNIRRASIEKFLYVFTHIDEELHALGELQL